MANLIRFNDPFMGLTGLHSQLDDTFNALFSSVPNATHSVPAMDVYAEDGKNIIAEVQAPGFDKNDIEIHVHDGTLEIKGEKHDQDEQKDKKRSYMIRESHVSFYRSIALPRGADASKVEAHFDNGVLKVTVPLKELPVPKKVSISSKKK